jgi:TonB-linked SusC/RagA family outer membrane protein
MMKIETNCLKSPRLRQLLFILLACSVPSFIWAQGMKEVSGTVYGPDGKALQGVNVTIKGGSRGATTNEQGRYSILAVNSDILVYSFTGHTIQEQRVGERAIIDVTLESGTSDLDQVVVVGYGEKKKVTVTGSVVSVKGRDLQKAPVVNLSNSLAGQLPGLIAVNRSGEPGRDGSEILIRGRNTTGNNAPLVLVDNVEYPDWQRLNANDIESISVLKDASAAIYGARAANGVILITTRRGTIGKPTISYSFNQGISTPTRLPKMASSYQLAEYFNDYYTQLGQPARFTDEELEKFRTGSDPVNYPNVDWYDEVMRDAVPQSQHNVNIRGGTENVKYSLSGSYGHQTGLFKGGNTDYKVYTLRSNVDLKINDWIRAGTEVNVISDNGVYPPIDLTWRFQLIPAFPWMPTRWPNGLPTPGFVNANPLVISSDATGYINNRNQRLQVRGNYEIMIPWVKGLGVEGFIVYNFGNTFIKTWQKPAFVYNYNSATDEYTPVAAFSSPAAPTLTQQNGNTRSSLFNLRIKYIRQFGNHNLNVFVAGEQQENFNNSMSAGRVNFPSPAIEELFAGSATNQTASGSASETGRQNVFGRFGYDFKEKYLLDFNFRYDGSANFPKGKRFGFFPGASVAWRISQEKFIMDGAPWITELKLRASYGSIGNDQVPAFQYLSTYSFTGGYSYGQTPTLMQGLIAGVSPNPNITWEVQKMQNFGLEGSLWNGLLDFTIDVFKNRRENILASRGLAVPAFTAISLPNENFGVVENKGFEAQLATRKTFGNFSYRVALNGAYARNRVVDIAESPNVPEWQRQTGRILGATRVYNVIGMFRTQEQFDGYPHMVDAKLGDLIYEDVNKDGLINAADQVLLNKSNIPEITFGAQVYLSWKNLSLFANIAGQDNAWTFFTITGRVNSNSLEDVIVNRWRPGSMDSKYPRLLTTGQQTSTFWLKDAQFVRLKTLEIGYDVPRKWLQKVRISSLRLYANGNNLITIDKLKWFDPEGIATFGDFYPQSKVYNLGFTLTF